MKNKLIVLVIIPIFILTSMSIIFVLRILSVNFTPRMFFYEQNIYQVQRSDGTLTFQVTSLEDYLGIVTIDNINALIPVHTDTLTFRIINLSSGLEVGLNSYPVDNVFYFDKIPFGFVVQSDSKNQVYQIVLSSSCDRQPCEFGPIDSKVTLRHYFPKSLFISNPRLVLYFLTEKLVQGISATSLSEYWQIFLYPLAVYFLLVWLVSNPARKFLVFFKSIDITNLVIILIDVLLQMTVLFWLTAPVFIYRMRMQQPVKFIVLIAITFVLALGLYLSGLNEVATRMSIWSFICVALYLLRLQQK